jgi:hypothetical protein
MRFSTRAWLLTLLLTAVVAVLPATALAVVPPGATTPTMTPVAIDTSAGDQTEPHVSGDWAAYTYDPTIAYYNFSTNLVAQIPLGGADRDLLSEVNGSKIVFSRRISGTQVIMVFDAATPDIPPVEIGPPNGGPGVYASIGGNTVAYIDQGINSHGELMIYDLATGFTQQITSDNLYDQNTSTSPDGNVVVWERCLTSPVLCDPWQAVKSGATWTVSAVTSAVSPEADPDTNGALVVYASQRVAEADIFWHSVGVGTETELQMPGLQSRPTIAGNLIAFESRPTFTDSTDIYAYDMLSNRLYRITETPSPTNEELADISVLPDGRVRVVWASDEEGLGIHNIRAATFQLAANPAAQIGDLITKTLDYLHLPALREPLRARLQAAIDAAVAGNRTAVCSSLQLYIVVVRLLPRGSLTSAQRAELIADATRIRGLLGC